MVLYLSVLGEPFIIHHVIFGKEPRCIVKAHDTKDLFAFIRMNERTVCTAIQFNRQQINNFLFYSFFHNRFSLEWISGLDFMSFHTWGFSFRSLARFCWIKAIKKESWRKLHCLNNGEQMRENKLLKKKRRKEEKLKFMF